MKYLFLSALLAIAPCSLVVTAEPVKTTVWSGTLHLGDNPMQFSSVTSVGMAMQIPLKLDPEKKGNVTFTTRDIQTLAGEGHFAELVAHYQDDDGPAREYVVETFRLKGNSNNADIDHTFPFDPMNKLYQKPAYYSFRIKVDTQIKFSLWDDFSIKRIEIEQ